MDNSEPLCPIWISLETQGVCLLKVEMKTRGDPLAISKFFSQASALQHVSLSGTKLPTTALRNFTLKKMPLPMSDLVLAYRNHPEKMEKVVHKMQSFLTRNQVPQNLHKEKCQIQLDLTSSSSKQAVSDVCQSLQRYIRMFSCVQDVEVKAEIQWAKEAVKDAVLHMDAIVQAKLEATRSLCPQILHNTGFWDHWFCSAPETAFLDQLLMEMCDHFMKIQLSVTKTMANSIIEKTLEELMMIQDRLMAAPWNHSCSPNLLSIPILNGPPALELKVGAEDNKSGSPQTKLSLSRASVKSRPASTKDAQLGSRLLPCSEPASAQSLMDLPTAGEKLEHYTRGRPRPNRRNRQPPSKSNVQPPVRENDEDRSIARLDEGLEEFFTKKVIHEHLLPVSLETSPAAAPSGSPVSRTFKMKIGHFFAFRKPKSGRGVKPERDIEDSPSPVRGRKLMLSDILRTPSKTSESAKALSKSEEGGLAAESKRHLEQSQTPDSGRRARPKYSREGKSQSLILLSGEEAEELGMRHEKKRSLERSDGELPSSFEQRVHVMLHRIGVTKVLSSEGKKKQRKDGEIKKAGSDGDIVDCSVESPPCSLKSQTHSISTDPSVQTGSADAAGQAGTEASNGSSEGRLSWKVLGKQLNVELKGKCSELSPSPRRVLTSQEPASPREQKGKESWSSSLPRTGRSTAAPPPIRRTSNVGEGRALADLQNSYANLNTVAGDNQFKAKPRLKPVVNRRAVSVHEEQLRDQACASELHHAKIPFCLQRSPILKWKIKPKSLLETGISVPSDSLGSSSQTQEKNTAASDSPSRVETEEELPQVLGQTLENAQNTALDQRTAVPLSRSPIEEH